MFKNRLCTKLMKMLNAEMILKITFNLRTLQIIMMLTSSMTNLGEATLMLIPFSSRAFKTST